MKKLAALFLGAAVVFGGAAVASADGPDNGGGPPVFVTICHAAGLAGEPANWITLTLPENAVYGQAGHFNENGTPNAGHEQDYLGACVTPTTPPPTTPPPTTPPPTTPPPTTPPPTEPPPTTPPPTEPPPTTPPPVVTPPIRDCRVTHSCFTPDKLPKCEREKNIDNPKCVPPTSNPKPVETLAYTGRRYDGLIALSFLFTILGLGLLWAGRTRART